MINLYEKYNKEFDFSLVYEDKTVINASGWVPNSDYDHTTREWYKGAMASGQTYVSKPYINAQDGTLVVTVVANVKKGDKVIGNILMDMSISKVEENIKKISVFKTGKASLITKDGQFISNSDYI